MKIGGIQKTSFVDFPQKIAATVFTQGCGFRCHFCHNEELVLPEKFKPSIAEEEIFSYLEKRKGLIDGVVISGGEPTLQPDLESFIRKVKQLGFLVKLDSSGINPEILKKLFDENLLNYIAMDIKAPIEKYEKVINSYIDKKKILESIDLILNSKVKHEFRTTLISSLHNVEDIVNMAKMIEGADLYILQKFINISTINKSFKKEKTLEEKDLSLAKDLVLKYVKNCFIR